MSDDSAAIGETDHVDAAAYWSAIDAISAATATNPLSMAVLSPVRPATEYFVFAGGCFLVASVAASVLLQRLGRGIVAPLWIGSFVTIGS